MEKSFNFGLTDKSANILDDIPLKSFIQKNLIVHYELYAKEDSNFKIYECKTEKKEVVNIKGNFDKPLELNHSYAFKGYVNKYQGEKQIGVFDYEEIMPFAKYSMICFLKSLESLEFIAEEIYEAFGMDSLEVILHSSKKLFNQFEEADKKCLNVWEATINSIEKDKESINQLRALGLSLKESKRLIKEHGEGISFKIKENPYVLANIVKGFGFKKSDDIAINLGYELTSDYRIQEGILYCLKEVRSQGHTMLPKEVFMPKVRDLLNIKLGITETKKLLNKKSNTFKYKKYNTTYTIKREDLQKSYDEYYASSKNTRTSKRYNLLNVTDEMILENVKQLQLLERVVLNNNNIYLREMFLYEEEIEYKVNAILKNKKAFKSNNEPLIDKYLKQKNIELEEKQKEAVVKFTKGCGGFHILNGNAGSGKTFTLNIIMKIFELMFQKENDRMPEVKLFAPTGRASKVIEEATSRKAMTIHRGLMYNPSDNSFNFNKKNPLYVDLLIVDEGSMLDLMLGNSLLNAINPETKIILIGDDKQLPSIDAGNILHDFLNYSNVEIVTLNVVKRQSEFSGIALNSKRIINKKPIETVKETKDSYVFNKQSDLDIMQFIIKIVKELVIKRKYSINDIEILSPKRNTVLGTDSLNYYIQTYFNKDKGNKVLNKRIEIYNFKEKKKESKSLYFKKGDKIIHLRNDYRKKWYYKGQYWEYAEDLSKKGIMNGEIGQIVEIRKEKDPFGKDLNIIIARYDDGYVKYENDFTDIDHAFALTIHKSQGSQWKAIIMPINKSLKNMLDNNLFYTGYSRAKLFNAVIGDEDSINYAIKTEKSMKRYTGLFRH